MGVKDREKGWTKVAGYLAAAGVKKIRRLDNNAVIAKACEVFGIKAESSCQAMAVAIASLGQDRRRSAYNAYRAMHGRRPVRPNRQRNMPSQAKIRKFYDSWEWKKLSYDIKLERGRRCECCGAAAPEVRIHTDHIKPVRHYWNLRFERSNLQVLCEDCNRGKASRDETDFRNENVIPDDYRKSQTLSVDGLPPYETIVWN